MVCFIYLPCDGRRPSSTRAASGTSLDREVQRLTRLLRLAEKDGLLLTVATRSGTLTEDPDTAVTLCQRVPGLGLTLDPSHYIAGSPQTRSFDQVYPFVRHTHLRDSGMKFSYLVLRKQPLDLVDAGRDAWRIVSAQRVAKGKLEIIGCSERGRVTLRLLKRNRAPLNRLLRIADAQDTKAQCSQLLHKSGVRLGGKMES